MAIGIGLYGVVHLRRAKTTEPSARNVVRLFGIVLVLLSLALIVGEVSETVGGVILVLLALPLAIVALVLGIRWFYRAIGAGLSGHSEHRRDTKRES